MPKREYQTPTTTDQAYRFGRKSALSGHKKMSRTEFMVTGQDHPFPSSLWRAYRHGYDAGQELKAQEERKDEQQSDG